MNSDMKFLSPLPTPIGGIIGTIVKIVKSIAQLFKGTSKEVGKIDSVNDNSTLDNIERVSQVFTGFQQQANIRLLEVERSISDEINYYLDELRQILDDHSGKVKIYGIRLDRIKRYVDKTADGTNGVIRRELSKMISLDNRECVNIMKMIPGSKKEDAMEAFLQHAFKHSINEGIRDLRTKLDEISYESEEEIIGAIQVVQEQSAILKERLETINGSEDKEIEQIKLVEEGYFCIEICELVLKVLVEE